MTSPSRRWLNLGAAAGAVTAVLFAAFDLYQWGQAYAGDRFHNDFTFYYAAARIGLAHGWPAIYDLHLQQVELDALGSGIKIAELARYISPPPVAWSALPFTALPYEPGYWVWSALLIAALVATWWLVAPGAGRVRLVHLPAAIGWLPVIYGLQLGQPGLFVALGVAASCAFLERDRRVWAGVALGAVVLKPQLAFLVPVAMLAARRERAFVAAAITLGILALVSAVALGPSGLSAYATRLDFAASVPVNRELTLAYFFGAGAVTRVVQLAIAAWSLVIAFRLRRRGAAWLYVCALVGGMLATPYVHLDDLAMLGLAVWLLIRGGAPAWSWACALGLVIAVEGEPIWGPAPVLLFELGALALLSAFALRRDEPVSARDARTLAQIDARPLELRPRR